MKITITAEEVVIDGPPFYDSDLFLECDIATLNRCAALMWACERLSEEVRLVHAGWAADRAIEVAKGFKL
jgi:hypothetical protein